MCFNFRSVMKKWRFSRFFSDTRIWREKRLSENESSLNHRNILKLKKLVSLTFWFSRKKNAIRVFSIEAKIHTDFLSRSFRSSKLEFGIPSGKFLTENLKKISKAVSCWGPKKHDLQNSFFYDEIFHTGSKTRWDKKKLNFNFSTHIIPTIFIFHKFQKNHLTKYYFTELD